MTRLQDLKKRLMEDPEFRQEYALADQEYALVAQLVHARTEANLTQAEVAQRLGTTQSVICPAGGRPGIAVDRHSPTLRRGYRHSAYRCPAASRGVKDSPVTGRRLRPTASGHSKTASGVSK